MGSLMSTENQYFIYSRNLETDKYDDDPIVSWTGTSDARAMGVFKREAHAFALHHQNYAEKKCIYLYKSVWRLARCQTWKHETRKIARRMEITFSQPEHKKQWYECDEKLGSGRWPLCQRMFDRAFTFERDVDGDPSSVSYVCL